METIGKCEVCGKDDGQFKVRDKRNGNILIICAFCEESYHELVQEDKGEKREENSKEGYEGMGRLHLVMKSKKENNCRECGKIILIGSLNYRQNVYGNSQYPSQSHLCESCGNVFKNKGFEVVKNGV